jgi:polysaccharide biosynthesis/export protein
MKTLSILLSLLMALGPVPAWCQPAAEADYFIEPGDVINLSVYPAEEFSREVTVQPDGTVEMPMLGSLRVQGLKPGDLQRQLASRLARYVSNPTVGVSVRRFAFNRVAIIGNSKNTGYFEYRDGMKLLDLLAQAGGLADYAQEDSIRIYRKNKGEGGRVNEEIVKADISSVFEGRIDRNIPLSNGDIVYVPRKGYASGSRWIADNFSPWLTLLTFALTVGLVTKN